MKQSRQEMSTSDTYRRCLTFKPFSETYRLRTTTRRNAPILHCIFYLTIIRISNIHLCCALGGLARFYSATLIAPIEIVKTIQTGTSLSSLLYLSCFNSRSIRLILTLHSLDFEVDVDNLFNSFLFSTI